MATKYVVLIESEESDRDILKGVVLCARTMADAEREVDPFVLSIDKRSRVRRVQVFAVAEESDLDVDAIRERAERMSAEEKDRERDLADFNRLKVKLNL